MKLDSISITSIASTAIEPNYYWGDVKIKIHLEKPDLYETILLRVVVQADPSESLRSIEDKVTNRAKEILRDAYALVQ